MVFRDVRMLRNGVDLRVAAALVNGKFFFIQHCEYMLHRARLRRSIHAVNRFAVQIMRRRHAGQRKRSTHHKLVNAVSDVRKRERAERAGLCRRKRGFKSFPVRI